MTAPPNTPIAWCDANGLIVECPIKGRPGEAYAMRYPRSISGLRQALDVLAAGGTAQAAWQPPPAPAIRGTPERQASAAAIVREVFPRIARRWTQI